MPAVDRVDEEKEKDRERDSPNDRSKTSKSAASKGKDVSHVPCKFFKVGSCTAGSSCPFSHTATEPGQKDVCAWFIKGTCKFGHKCALAHILPGQPMSMDRKNKKASQVANGGGGGGGGPERGPRDGPPGKDGKGRKRDNIAGTRSSAPQLLSGSTAPTRPGRSPMSMSLKATISPSAPAPPLKDTDFASLGVLDEEVAKLPNAPAQGRLASSTQASPTPDAPNAAPTPPEETPTTSTTTDPASNNNATNSPSPVPLPVNSPRRPGAPTSHGSPNIPDFGPIGSPPRGSTTPRINGLSPSTSPNTGPAAFLSTSPFSAPGSQTVFAGNNNNTHGPNGVGMRGGIAASLGTGLAMQGRWATGPNEGYGSPVLPSQGHMASRSISRGGRINAGEFDINIEYEEQQRRRGDNTAVEDGDLEDFIPSSLTDLLTPEERSRRMSRSNSGQSPSGQGLAAGVKNMNLGPGNSAGPGVNGAATGHRYSRSVPSTSLIGEMANIWSDTNGPSSTAINAALPSSPSRLGELGNGTPSSFNKSPLQTTFGGRTDDTLLGTPHSPSPSLLSPTNASAAFLPSIHQHYLNSKSKQANTNIGLGPALGRGVRNASNPLYASGGPGLNPGNTGGLGISGETRGAISASIGNYLQTGGAGLSSSPGQVHTFTRPTPYDPNTAAATEAYLRGGVRPIPSGMNGGLDADAHLMSPNSRALQTHAPGQSLPQGLAAGYSRIHALPPLPLASPSSAGGMSISPGPGTLNNLASANSHHLGGGATEWATLDNPTPKSANNLYESLIAQQQHYSRGPPPPGLGLGINAGAAGANRNVSAGKNSALSPLRGVVNDDDIFDMENF